jgi:hypothetical protein
MALSKAMMAMIMAGDSAGADKMAAGAGNMESAIPEAAMGSESCPECDDAYENEMDEDEGPKPKGGPKAMSIELWKTDLFKGKPSQGKGPMPAMMAEMMGKESKGKGRGRRA